jgi:hypothetical protein
MDRQDEIRSSLRAASFVAAAVVASLGITLVVAEIIRLKLQPFTGFAPKAGTPEVRYAVFGAAVAAVVLVRVLRQALLGRPSRQDTAGALLRLQRAAVVTLVLSEIPGILGFVLFLLGGYNRDLYVLVFVSLFLVFMHYPRRANWEDWLRV